MKQLLTEEWLEVPSDIKVSVKSRKVTVKGRKGEVSKDFSHIPCEIQTMKQNDKKKAGNYIRIRMWFGTYKNACSVRTLRSLIKNMFTGVHEVSPLSSRAHGTRLRLSQSLGHPRGASRFLTPRVGKGAPGSGVFWPPI